MKKICAAKWWMRFVRNSYGSITIQNLVNFSLEESATTICHHEAQYWKQNIYIHRKTIYLPNDAETGRKPLVKVGSDDVSIWGKIVCHCCAKEGAGGEWLQLWKTKLLFRDIHQGLRCWPFLKIEHKLMGCIYY